MADSDIPPEEKGDLLGAQKSLISAQQEFIRLQQNLLITRERGDASDSVGGSRNEVVRPQRLLTAQHPALWAGDQSRKLEIPDEKSLEGQALLQPGETAANSGSLRELVSRYTLTGVIPLVFGILIIVMLFRGPKDINQLREQLTTLRQKNSDELSRAAAALAQSQAEVVANQKALRETQEALKNTEQALLESQKEAGIQVASSSEPRPMISSNTTTTEQATAEALENSQRDLHAARKALKSNQEEAYRNWSGYLENAKDIAHAKRALEQLRLSLGVAKNQLSPSVLLKPARPWEDYLPEMAKRLLADPRFDSTRSAGVNSDETIEEPLPDTLQEVQALLAKTIRELTGEQKEVVRAEKELTRAQQVQIAIQADIVKAQMELRTIQDHSVPAESEHTSSLANGAADGGEVLDKNSSVDTPNSQKTEKADNSGL